MQCILIIILSLSAAHVNSSCFLGATASASVFMSSHPVSKIRLMRARENVVLTSGLVSLNSSSSAQDIWIQFWYRFVYISIVPQFLTLIGSV